MLLRGRVVITSVGAQAVLRNGLKHLISENWQGQAGQKVDEEQKKRKSELYQPNLRKYSGPLDQVYAISKTTN